MRNPKKNAYMSRVMDQMLGDLQWPVGKDGTTVQTDAFRAIIAWHLVRAGWRKPNNLDQFPLIEEFDDPIIKKRKLIGPGIIEDAVEWVDFNEPDDPLEHLADMTMGQIEALPEHLRIEAKRRMGLAPERPRPEDIPTFGVEKWSVAPLVQITDAPEDDNTNLTS